MVGRGGERAVRRLIPEQFAEEAANRVGALLFPGMAHNFGDGPVNGIVLIVSFLLLTEPAVPIGIFLRNYVSIHLVVLCLRSADG